MYVDFKNADRVYYGGKEITRVYARDGSVFQGKVDDRLKVVWDINMDTEINIDTNMPIGLVTVDDELGSLKKTVGVRGGDLINLNVHQVSYTLRDYYYVGGNKTTFVYSPEYSFVYGIHDRSTRKEVTLPNGCNFIEAHALQDVNIYNINLPSSLVRIDKYGLSRNPFTEINIPSNITMVYEGAFWECKNLKRVKLPNTLHTIQRYAFSGCTSLENIFLPDSLTKIGNSAFMDCSIKKLVIPKNVSTLEAGAFKNNKGLRYVKIPNRLKSTFSGYLMSSWFTDETGTDTNITYEYY